MKTPRHVAALFTLAVLTLTSQIGLALPDTQAPQPNLPPKEVKDLLPYKRFAPLKGHAVGVLILNGNEFSQTEGRTGLSSHFCTNMSSYDWIYLPHVPGKPGNKLKLPVGEKGDKQEFAVIFGDSRDAIKALGVSADYTLAEVEVNGGQGRPATQEGFVVTGIRVLEGTRDYPLKTADVIKEARDRLTRDLKTRERAVEEALGKIAKRVLKKDQRPTGPRENKEVMYVTWIPETQRQLVCFRMEIADGSYSKVKTMWTGPKAQQKVVTVSAGPRFGLAYTVKYGADKTGQIVNTEVSPFVEFDSWTGPRPEQQVQGDKKG